MIKTNQAIDPNVSAWPQLEYHATQTALWECLKRFVYVPAGRASGKTELSLRRLVACLPIEKEWEPTYVYAGPTYAQAKRTAWKKLKTLCPSRWIADVSESELSITTVFGSTLFLVGLDKPERIEGIQIDGIRGQVKYRLFSWEQRSSPLETLKVAISKAMEYGARHVGVEINQGGDLWRSEYRQACFSLGITLDRAPAFKAARAGVGAARSER